VACDVVPELIDRNRRIFPGQNFRHVDITSDDLPIADVALCRQVLQHLDNRQILAFLQKIRGYRFLIVTEHLPTLDFTANSRKLPGAGIRVHQNPPSGVVLTAAPFNLHVKLSDVLCEVPDGENAVLRTTCYELPQ
jgi:hypothetical protein